MRQTLYAVGCNVKLTKINIYPTPFIPTVSVHVNTSLSLNEMQASLCKVRFFKDESSAIHYALSKMTSERLFGKNIITSKPLVFCVDVEYWNKGTACKVTKINSVIVPDTQDIKLPSDFSAIKLVNTPHYSLFARTTVTSPIICNKNNFHGDFKQLQSRVMRKEELIALQLLYQHGKLVDNKQTRTIKDLPKPIIDTISEYIVETPRPKPF